MAPGSREELTPTPVSSILSILHNLNRSLLERYQKTKVTHRPFLFSNPYDAHQLYDQQSPQLSQYGQYPQQPAYQPNQVDYSGQYSEKRDVYAPAGQTRQPDEEEDTTGPPKGFFYSYDYPVGIIVQKEGLVKRGAN